MAEKMSLNDEIMKRAQDDIKVRSMSIDTMITETKEELTITQNEIAKAKEALAQMLGDVEKAINNGNSIPKEYGMQSQELFDKIVEQNEKLQDLEPRLENLVTAQTFYAGKLKEQAHEAAKDNRIDHAKAIIDHAKDMLQTVKNGLADIGASIHEKLAEFGRGTKSAMLTVGDKAQEIFSKVMEAVIDKTERFKDWAQENVGKARDWTQGKIDDAKDKAIDLKTRLGELGEGVKTAGINLGHAMRDLKEAPIESGRTWYAKTYDSQMSLNDRINQATEKMAGQGHSIVANALYNLAVDRSRNVTSQYINYLETELARRSKQAARGVTINEKSTGELMSKLAGAKVRLENLNQVAAKIFTPKERAAVAKDDR